MIDLAALRARVVAQCAQCTGVGVIVNGAPKCPGCCGAMAQRRLSAGEVLALIDELAEARGWIERAAVLLMPPEEPGRE